MLGFHIKKLDFNADIFSISDKWSLSQTQIFSLRNSLSFLVCLIHTFSLSHIFCLTLSQFLSFYLCQTQFFFLLHVNFSQTNIFYPSICVSHTSYITLSRYRHFFASEKEFICLSVSEGEFLYLFERNVVSVSI